SRRVRSYPWAGSIRQGGAGNGWLAGRGRRSAYVRRLGVACHRSRWGRILELQPPGPARRAVAGRSVRSVRCGNRLAGQAEHDGRATTRLGLDADRTVRLPHEAVDLREAETGAVALRLGGEEGLERPRRHCRRHARARVAHDDADMLARLAVRLALLLGDEEVGGGDREPAAIRHGIARIDGEVEERALELVGVDPYRPQAVR